MKPKKDKHKILIFIVGVLFGFSINQFCSNKTITNNNITKKNRGNASTLNWKYSDSLTDTLTIESSMLFRGKVIDIKTNESLSCIRINIEGVEDNYVTDSDGCFFFDLDRATNKIINYQAQCIHNNYSSIRRRIEIVEKAMPIEIRLRPLNSVKVDK